MFQVYHNSMLTENQQADPLGDRQAHEQGRMAEEDKAGHTDA